MFKLTKKWLFFSPKGDFAAFAITVTGPDDFYMKQNFAGDETPFLELADQNGNLLADGLYTYELVAVPNLSDDIRQEMREARMKGDRDVAALLRERGDLPNRSLVQSGTVTILDGTFVNPVSEAVYTASKEFQRNNGDGTLATDADPDRAQVFVTDVVVQGSLCVGFDCVNGESFGFDTLRLKENNLRIHFQDTSVSASFPSNDWRIVANDTGNGGANYLAFEDSSAGTYPFRVLAGAGNNALYVDAQGDVGVGTSSPVVELHVASGDSPTLRLEQNGSSGFTAQTWDVAGNETNFFVRDATNGSPLPLRIRPSAPQNSIFVDTDGDVGLGTASPSFGLHTVGDIGAVSTNGSVILNASGTSYSAGGGTINTDASFIVDDTSAGASRLMELINSGTVTIRLSNTVTGGEKWDMQSRTNGYLLSESTSGVDEMLLEPGGNVTFAGSVTPMSSRFSKENFEPIDNHDVLARVLGLPITKWNYKHDEDTVRHVGVMAQDFHAAFEVGADDCHLTTADTAGVALASIQALHEIVSEKDSEIDRLNNKLDDQAARLEKLEALLLNK